MTAICWPTVPISFATYGAGGAEQSARGPIAGYASVDVSEEEAERLLRKVPDVRSVIYANVARNEATRSLERLLNDELHGRTLVGLHDMRPAIADAVARLVLEPLPRRSGPDGDAPRHRLTDTISAFLSSEQDFDENRSRLDGALALTDPDAILDLLTRHTSDPAGLATFFASHRDDIARHLERVRPLSLAEITDADDAAHALRAHQAAWGCRHRLIATTCAEGPASAGIDLVPASPGTRFYVGPVAEGYWRAWRSDRPISIRPTGGSSTLKLAAFLAAAVVAMSRLSGDGSSTFPIAFATCYFGDADLVPRLSHQHMERLERRVAEFSNRATAWLLDVAENEHRLPDAMRIASRISGGDVRSSRDRLILKMLGRGLGPGAILPLRVEELEVNGFDDLFDRSWSANRLFAMDDEDVDDFWTLVEAGESLEGFLFSRASDGEPYGRHGLSRSEFDAIVALRTAEHPLDDRRVAA